MKENVSGCFFLNTVYMLSMVTCSRMHRIATTDYVTDDRQRRRQTDTTL